MAHSFLSQFPALLLPEQRVELAITKVAEANLRGLAPNMLPELLGLIQVIDLLFGDHAVPSSVAFDCPRLALPDECGLFKEDEASQLLRQQGL